MKNSGLIISTIGIVVTTVLCSSTDYGAKWLIPATIFWIIGVASLILWLLEHKRSPRAEAKSGDKQQQNSKETTTPSHGKRGEPDSGEKIPQTSTEMNRPKPNLQQDK